MTPRLRAASAAIIVCLTASLVACGDDANDAALQAQQLADRLAAERGETTVPDPDPAPVTSPSTVGGGATASPGSTAPPATVTRTGVVVPVIALDNSFRPQSIEAKVGDEVVWENRGRNEHDILSIEGTLADGSAWGLTVDEFQPGDIYAHVFTEPGEYRYYCTIHGTSDVGMVGTVVVTA